MMLSLYSIDSILTHQQHTAFENIVGNKQFLLFPQCFLLNQIIVSPFVNIFDIVSLFAAVIGISGEGVFNTCNPLLHNAKFNDSEELDFQKQCGKKTLLVTNTFSLSHHVFYPIKGETHHLCHTEIMVCKCFQFAQTWNFVIQ